MQQNQAVASQSVQFASVGGNVLPSLVPGKTRAQVGIQPISSYSKYGKQDQVKQNTATIVKSILSKQAHEQSRTAASEAASSRALSQPKTQGQRLLKRSSNILQKLPSPEIDNSVKIPSFENQKAVRMTANSHMKYPETSWVDQVPFKEFRESDPWINREKAQISAGKGFSLNWGGRLKLPRKAHGHKMLVSHGHCVPPLRM